MKVRIDYCFTPWNSMLVGLSWLLKIRALKTLSYFQIQQPQYCRGDICHCRHCRRQFKIFASGVNFSRKQHFSRIKTEISSSLIYLCFFSKTCWIRSFLTKICLNYLHLCINTIKTWVKNVANYVFYRCKILGLKSRCVKS